MQYTIVREMSLTYDDFFRLLPGALKGSSYRIENNVVYINLDTGYLKISLSPQSQRAVGSLLLPMIQVTFEFDDCPENDRKLFFENFDLAYQKGGG